MRFTIREGTDPVARADGTLLRALGLPAGGVVAVGRSAVLVKAGQVADPTGLSMGPTSRENAGVSLNQSVDVTRAVLGPAATVAIDADELPAESRRLVRAL